MLFTVDISALSLQPWRVDDPWDLCSCMEEESEILLKPMCHVLREQMEGREALCSIDFGLERVNMIWNYKTKAVGRVSRGM